MCLMSEQPNRQPDSSGDDIEEILRQYRMKNGQNADAPAEDDDVKIADDLQDTRAYVPSARRAE